MKSFSRLCLFRLIPVMIGCAAAVQAQTNNPLDDPFPSSIKVAVEEWLTIPASNPSAPRARINHLKPGPGGSRLFCNDLNGRLWLISSSSATSAGLYLDMAVHFPNFIKAPGLGTGFTSFAFHPEFLDVGASGYGKFYTAHSEASTSGGVDLSGPVSAATSQVGVITEWTLTNPAASSITTSPLNFSRRTLLRIGFPFDYHDLQEISFNPTATPGSEDYGCLFICIGDGGSIVQNNPANLGRIDSPLGSILRITPVLASGHAPADFTLSANGAYYIPSGASNANPHVLSADPTPGDGFPVVREIYANGFRNPHRISWDTGGMNKMFCGNIGESVLEEVELVEKGRNYGWPLREGSFVFTYLDKTNVYPLPIPDNAGFTYPVVQYDHGSGFAIAGGSVYRGSEIPELQGYYVFGDIVNGRIWIAPEEDMNLQTTTATGETAAQPLELGLKVGSTSTTFLSILGASRADLRFGTDHGGEIYLLSKQNGRLYKIKQDDFPSVAPPAGVPSDWVKVSDFEDGSTDGFTTSPSTSGSFSVVNDPSEGPVNRVLRQQAYGTVGNLLSSIPIPEIPDDSYGTLFLRVFVPGQDHNINFGLSDVTNPSSFSSFEMQMRSYLSSGEIQVRNGGVFSGAAAIQSGTWYSVWSQIYNAPGSTGDTWNLYLKGGGLTTPTLVRSDIAFRNGTTSSLKRFLSIVSPISGSGEPQNGQEIYFDDIHVDVGHANITEPIEVGWQLVDQFEDGATLDDWQIPDEAEQSVTLLTESDGNRFLRHAASPDISVNSNAVAATALPFVTQVSQTLTLFFRMKIEGQALDQSIGVSALNPVDPSAHVRSEFEPEIRISAGGLLGAYDGPAGAADYVSTSLLAGLETDTWYKIWLVANNGGFASGGQTWAAYAQGPQDSTPIAITPELFFRKGSENPITHFVSIASNDAGGNDAICIDDIFASRGANLGDPIRSQPLRTSFGRNGSSLELSWPTRVNRLFQAYESTDLVDWTTLTEPIEGDGNTWLMDQDIDSNRKFFRTLEHSRRAFVPATWESDFSDSNLPAGMKLVRANSSVNWTLAPNVLQLSNSPASAVSGMVGRPGGYALVPGDWRNVTVTVEGRSLADELTVNRDICLVFGYVDDTHFYYAHLSRSSDGAVHTVIMKVEGSTRGTIHTPIATGPNAGPLVSSATNPIWQTLRVTHDSTGAIAAYVDDMTVPVLSASDTTYPVGRVGCGTFDDPAEFRFISVTGDRQ